MTTEATSAPSTGEAATTSTAQTADVPAPETTSLTEGAPPAAEKPTDGEQPPKAEGEQPAAESKDETKEGDKPAEVPETYEFQMPEGMVLDEVAAGELTEVAHGLKLNQEQVSKLTEIGIKMRQRDAERHAATVKGWSEAMQKDSELGGDKFAENLAIARKTLQTYASPELKDVLRATGLDQHPEMFRFVHKLGSALAEDRFVPGGPGVSTSDDAKAARMYPTMQKR